MNESPKSAVAAWSSGWDEEGLREFARQLRLRLGEHPVTLGLLFVSPTLAEHAQDLLELIRVHAQVPLLAGCSARGVVVGGKEIEDSNGLVLGLYSLPGATIHPVVITGAEEGGGPREVLSADAGDLTGWLAFVEPFQTAAESWIESWQDAFPNLPIFGGLAVGKTREPQAQVYLNGEVLEHGGVALGFSGVRLMGAVAQGCTPVGETWTITRTEGNIIHRIGNRPAVAVLEETFSDLDEDLRQRSRGNFFAGLAVDEYREDHQRGDFVVRGLVGADPDSGAIAVGAIPRQGQTMQFQLRDAEAADDDIQNVLRDLRDRVGRSEIYGGCLCTCVGRGQELFGERDHDAGFVRQILGPIDVSGFFCNGEFGPVGSRSFVHGYTASLVLFVGPPRSAEDEL